MKDTKGIYVILTTEAMITLWSIQNFIIFQKFIIHCQQTGPTIFDSGTSVYVIKRSLLLIQSWEILSSVHYLGVHLCSCCQKAN